MTAKWTFIRKNNDVKKRRDEKKFMEKLQGKGSLEIFYTKGLTNKNKRDKRPA